MRFAPTLMLLIAALAGAPGCAEATDVPPPPPRVDSSLDGSFVTPPTTRRDAGGATDAGSSDAGSSDAGGGCLTELQGARVLFVLDRSDTMADFAIGGDGSALNVLASTAAADLIAPLPAGSEAGLLLFPSQIFDDPGCPGIEALANQYPLRSTAEMEGTLRALWTTEGVIFGKPRARALQRAAEGLTGTDLSDTLVVVFSDSAAGCAVGGELDGRASLEGRGARVVSITLATRSTPADGTTPGRYSRVSEVLAVLQPALEAVRRRCEAL